MKCELSQESENGLQGSMLHSDEGSTLFYAAPILNDLIGFFTLYTNEYFYCHGACIGLKCSSCGPILDRIDVGDSH